MALMFLLAPALIVLVLIMLSLLFFQRKWKQKGRPADKQYKNFNPARLLNHNQALPVKMEWIMMLIGFLAVIFWFEVGPGFPAVTQEN